MHFITKTFNPGKGYSCVFRQPSARSHCRLFHGYDLIFSVTLASEELDTRGWVFDFGGLKPLATLLDSTFDHKMVVSEDDPHLDTIGMLSGLDIADVVVLPQVGCEAFASWFFHRAEEHLAQHYTKAQVVATTVREHDGNLAGYSPSGLPLWELMK